MQRGNVRRTKIISTLGPATDSPEMIGKLIDAGVNIFRLNMSHAPHDWVRRIYASIRAESAQRARHIGILMDTQGPAIRTGDLGVPLDLQPGQKFTLTVRGERDLEQHSVDVNYENFINDISIGDVVLIDNGAIEMKVLAKNGNKVECEVLTEGKLGSRRHINLPGVKVSLPALTAKDIKDVRLGLELNVDFIALSFVREARDLLQLRELFPDKTSRTRSLSPKSKTSRPSSIWNPSCRKPTPSWSRAAIWGLKSPTRNCPLSSAASSKHASAWAGRSSWLPTCWKA